MSRSKLLVALAAILTISLTIGCNDQLKLQNQRQRETIAKLESELQAAKLQLNKAEAQLADAGGQSNVKTDALQQTIAALEKDIAQKKAMLESVGKGLTLGSPLPAELAIKLDELQKSSSNMITFEAGKGLIRFQSDLLFDKGSDEVSAAGVKTIQTLCSVLNSEEGKQFDVIIAGHTDDVPISRAETKAKYPTNWHLSAGRAISVLTIMSSNGISPGRMSARGFGEYRPLEPNAASRQGNAKNRRVEIYIVPKGV